MSCKCFQSILRRYGLLFRREKCFCFKNMLAVISGSIFFSTPLSEVLWDGFVASIGDLLPFQAFSPENEGFTSKFLPDFNSGQISTF